MVGDDPRINSRKSDIIIAAIMKPVTTVVGGMLTISSLSVPKTKDYLVHEGINTHGPERVCSSMCF